LSLKRKNQFVGSIGDFLNQLPEDKKSGKTSTSTKKFLQHEKIFSKEFKEIEKVKISKVSVDMGELRASSNTAGISSATQKNQYKLFDQNPEEDNKNSKGNLKNGGTCVTEICDNKPNKNGKRISIDSLPGKK